MALTVIQLFTSFNDVDLDKILRSYECLSECQASEVNNISSIKMREKNVKILENLHLSVSKDVKNESDLLFLKQFFLPNGRKIYFGFCNFLLILMHLTTFFFTLLMFFDLVSYHQNIIIDIGHTTPIVR